jgi:hypothetical protein
MELPPKGTTPPNLEHIDFTPSHTTHALDFEPSTHEEHPDSFPFKQGSIGKIMAALMPFSTSLDLAR